MTFRDLINNELNEGKNEDLVSSILKDKGVSEEDVKKIMDSAKEEDLKVSAKANYVYFKKSGSTSRVNSDFFKNTMRSKRTYELLTSILPKASFNISGSRSGTGNSATFKYTATINVGL